jgi:hypothetical protein
MLMTFHHAENNADASRKGSGELALAFTEETCIRHIWMGQRNDNSWTVGWQTALELKQARIGQEAKESLSFGMEEGKEKSGPCPPRQDSSRQGRAVQISGKKKQNIKGAI